MLKAIMKNAIPLAGLFCLLAISASWAAERYVPKIYEPVYPPQPTRTGEKIEVVEVFWYGCPHCYSLEPYLDQWLEKKPDDVEFLRLPAVLGKGWIPHARAYFTAEKLGLVDKIHGPLFDAIHRDGEHINDENRLGQFFSEYGVDKGEFTRIFNSEDVDDKVKESYVMGKRYGITGVPAIIVNGKYRTSASMTGGNSNLMAAIDQLIEMERSRAKSE